MFKRPDDNSAETPHTPDDYCSKHFKFSDLFFAGETYRLHQPQNIPLEKQTWCDFQKLAQVILDPVVDHFGAINITYGYAGSPLIRLVNERIAPNLDQHAGSERSKLGSQICSRGGASVDFFSADHDSFEVAKWIVEHLEFDRMYLYGRNRPIHISISKEPLGYVYMLRELSSSRFRVPRRLPKTELNDLLFNER
jgi:hypothetical protein